jgi:ATP-binding cassette subfamily B protein
MMDCGPSSLKSLLEGHGIHVDYGKLRDICYTDVDGTSIDTMEELAVGFGLDAEQVVVPTDFVFAPETMAFPSIAVIVLPTGSTHFCLAWRRHGNLVQVMDPANGRLWLSRASFQKQLYRHTMPIDAATWREWVAGEEFSSPLRRRLLGLGFSASAVAQLFAHVNADPTWRSYATLDAAARMVSVIRSSDGFTEKAQATALFKALFEADLLLPNTGEHIIPVSYWSAHDHDRSALGDGEIMLTGSVLVRVRGHLASREGSGDTEPVQQAARPPEDLERKIASAQTPKQPALRRLIGYLKQDGLLSPLVLGMTILLGALAVFFEALVFKTLLELGKYLSLVEQQVGAVAALVVFALAVLFLELSTERGLIGLGRRLEARFRIDFLKQLPRLADSYFSSRLTSDLAERIHSVMALRGFPHLGARLLRNLCVMLLTALGIAWIDPACAPWALLAAVAAVAFPLAFHPLLSEVQHSVRTYQGSLTSFYLDALLGLTPLLSHGAARAIKADHESVLTQWAHARLRQTKLSVAVNFGVAMLGVAFMLLILYVHLRTSADISAVLLLVYWALALPELGNAVAVGLLAYPAQRSVALRLLEPLDAEVERELPAEGAPQAASKWEPGVAIDFDGVGLEIAASSLLREVSLRIAPGQHVAIIGGSGAGKSTLLGLVLGWHAPSSGRIAVDGAPCDQESLARLWSTLAWVDPQVQLWNRSVLGNLSYGQEHGPALDIANVLETADFSSVVKNLPDGLCAVIGEGGGLLSEGEGQRLRLGRALLKQNVRLVVMDEPFRGLDRSKRRVMLRRALDGWAGATIIAALHDVREAELFDWVVVLGNGMVLEQGPPATLLSHEHGHLVKMIESDRELEQFFEDPTRWSRCHVENKTVVKAPREVTP